MGIFCSRGLLVLQLTKPTNALWGHLPEFRLKGLRSEESTAEPCHREGISNSRHCGLSKEFLNAVQEEARGRHRPGGHVRQCLRAPA